MLSWEAPRAAPSRSPGWPRGWLRRLAPGGRKHVASTCELRAECRAQGRDHRSSEDRSWVPSGDTGCRLRAVAARGGSLGSSRDSDGHTGLRAWVPAASYQPREPEPAPLPSSASVPDLSKGNRNEPEFTGLLEAHPASRPTHLSLGSWERPVISEEGAWGAPSRPRAHCGSRGARWWQGQGL